MTPAAIDLRIWAEVSALARRTGAMVRPTTRALAADIRIRAKVISIKRQALADANTCPDEQR